MTYFDDNFKVSKEMQPHYTKIMKENWKVTNAWWIDDGYADRTLKIDGKIIETDGCHRSFQYKSLTETKYLTMVVSCHLEHKRELARTSEFWTSVANYHACGYVNENEKIIFAVAVHWRKFQAKVLEHLSIKDFIEASKKETRHRWFRVNRRSGRIFLQIPFKEIRTWDNAPEIIAYEYLTEEAESIISRQWKLKRMVENL